MLTKPRVPSRPLETSMYASRQRRRQTPLLLIGLSVPVLLALIAGAVFVLPYIKSHAATAVNPNCTLRVPENPLTAQGLATPYQLSATDAAQGPCNEANVGQSAFIQAAIFDPATNTLSAYEPLVVDKGTQSAVAPVVPQIPEGAIVGIWFGFNGTILHLQGNANQGHCVNGLGGSDFGQFAYCNAPQFFQNVNSAIQANKIKVPAIGMAQDGQTCLTMRSFALVDMDQSDNVQTQYLTNGNGQIAQFSAGNQAALPNATTIANPSDNALLSRFVNPALGCQSWEIPDLANNGAMVATLATNELQAAANQIAPIALVPSGDEMVLVNNQVSLAKVNAYRIGVNQQPAATLNDANTTAYCSNLINVALPRLQLDMQAFQKQPSPDGGVTANSLFTFLANRLNATLGANGLNCVGLLNIQNPVTLTTNNGVVTNATLTVTNMGTGTGTGTGMGTGMGTGTGTGATAPNCNVNGTTVAGCMGTTTINGQTCTLAFANGTVTVTCPNNLGTGTGTGTPNPTVLPFDNSGISSDTSMAVANFDSVGFSYSAQALQNAGFFPGKKITVNQVTFVWPTSVAGTPDNVMAQGQTIPVTAINGAKTLAFLGSASFGPSMGNGTITYTDGSRQAFTLSFSDWTLNGGRSMPLNGNQIVATTAYRNSANGVQLGQMPNVFYTSAALQAGKTIKSVTLPAQANHGQLHVFAIGTK